MSKINPKRTGGGDMMSPDASVCAACDVKFFDLGGGKEYGVRLSQLFLDSLCVIIPDDEEQLSSLRFCPSCSLKLNELDCLMSNLETLQVRIQSLKSCICATVTNTAFSGKHGSEQSEPGPCDEFLLSIRDHAVQNWVALSKGDSDVAGTRTEALTGGGKSRQSVDRSKGISPSAADLEFREQNALEIFDQLEEQEEIEEDNNLDYAASSPSNIPCIIEEAEPEVSTPTTMEEIKLVDPRTWRMMSSLQSYSNNSGSNSTDTCYIEEVRQGSKSSGATTDAGDGDTVVGPSNGIESMYYDESESESSNGYTASFSNTDVAPVSNDRNKAIPSNVARIVQPEISKAAEAFFRRNHLLKPATSRNVQAAVAHVPTILRSPPARAFPTDKSVEIQMCTLCYKYIADGIKHNCGEKSGTTMYQCGYCNAVFHSERVLNEHVRRHIPPPPETTAKRASYVCKVCRNTFTSSAKLAAHVKSEHKVKRRDDVIKCQLCPKVFRDISLFRMHLIVHSKKSNLVNRVMKDDVKMYGVQA